MATVVSAVDARRSMGKWINTVVLKEEDVIIERAGKPVARLTSCAVRQNKEAGTGQLDLRSARGLGKELWQTVDVAHYLAGERDAWD